MIIIIYIILLYALGRRARSDVRFSYRLIHNLFPECVMYCTILETNHHRNTENT